MNKIKLSQWQLEVLRDAFALLAREEKQRNLKKLKDTEWLGENNHETCFAA